MKKRKKKYRNIFQYNFLFSFIFPYIHKYIFIQIQSYIYIYTSIVFFFSNIYSNTLLFIFSLKDELIYRIALGVHRWSRCTALLSWTRVLWRRFATLLTQRPASSYIWIWTNVYIYIVYMYTMNVYKHSLIFYLQLCTLCNQQQKVWSCTLHINK